MNDLMQGILGSWDLTGEKRKPVHLEIFDGESISDESLLYDSQPGYVDMGDKSRTLFQRRLVPSSRPWTLRFTRTSRLSSMTDYGKVWLVLSGGTCSSLLLCGLFFSVLNTRFKALQMAKKLTTKLALSEQSYRNQFASNSEVMLLLDPTDGAIIDANAVAVSFYGYPRDRLLAMGMTDINPKPLADVLQILKYLRAEQGQRFQFQHRLANGELREVEVSMSAIEFDGRSVLHSIVFDVTERERVKELLRQATESLALATRAGGVGLWNYDVASNRMVWDNQMLCLYGITRDRFDGTYQAWQAKVHPDDRQRGHQEFQLALRDEKDFDTEYRALWPDGNIHYIRALAIVQRDASGQAVYMLGTNWDITTQKQAEQKRFLTATLMNLMTELSLLAFYVVDNRTDKIIYFNHRFCEIWGITHLEEQMARGELTSNQIVPYCLDALANVSEFAKSWELLQKPENRVIIEDFLPFTNGRTIRRCSSQMRCANDEYFGRFYLFEDVTEKEQAEAKLIDINHKLKQATDQAEFANAAKRQFLASMSREIRAPLDRMRGMVGLLLNTNLTEDQRRYAQTARTSGEIMLARINDILDFSKIEVRNIELKTLGFDVRSLLKDFVGMMALRAYEKGLALECVVSPEVPSALQGDSERLRQILINLTDNAIQFTTQGEVVIRVNVVSETPIDVRLRFAVRDTGIGISADKLGRLFEKFSQVETSTDGACGGKGLGLAISKQLTAMMDGEIGVQSEAGKGSEFWFTALLTKQPFHEPAVTYVT
jgi:PAS domain S-box-containing protein